MPDQPDLDQLLFPLDTKRFEELTAMLAAPPDPNPGLERLMALTAPWHTEAK